MFLEHLLNEDAEGGIGCLEGVAFVLQVLERREDVAGAAGQLAPPHPEFEKVGTNR